MPLLSTKDIRRKINSVRNIQQICRAMKTISSLHLKRAEDRLGQARPYGEKLTQVLSRLAVHEPEHPMLKARPVSRLGVVAISSDRGLCGSYNANLLREAAQQMNSAVDSSAIAVGRKAADAFRRWGFQPVDRLVPFGQQAEFLRLAPLADRIGELYQSGEWDRVLLIYSRFLGGARIQVSSWQMLPVEPPSEPATGGEVIYEPDRRQILDSLLPRYLRTALYTAALEASASEHAARVAAMTLASDNAQELIEDLTMQYNKARQAAITEEILDIVGTAEALR